MAWWPCSAAPAIGADPATIGAGSVPEAVGQLDSSHGASLIPVLCLSVRATRPPGGIYGTDSDDFTRGAAFRRKKPADRHGRLYASPVPRAAQARQNAPRSETRKRSVPPQLGQGPTHSRPRRFKPRRPAARIQSAVVGIRATLASDLPHRHGLWLTASQGAKFRDCFIPRTAHGQALSHAVRCATASAVPPVRSDSIPTHLQPLHPKGVEPRIHRHGTAARPCRGFDPST